MGTTTQTQRVDEIVKMAGGTFPLHGRVGLCRRCGGDPKVATGRAAIGTAGCPCGVNILGGPDRVMPLDVTTEVGETRADLWRTIEACDGLDWQLLTKRPENILAMVPAHWRTAWPAHIWIGTTVEDQRRAEERIPHLLRVPAAVRFLSCEPLLERIDLAPWLFVDGEDDWCGCGRGARAIIGDGFHRCAACGVTEPAEGSALSWVIVGGESGPGARPFDLAWARSILRQCAEAGVACFVKQLGACASDPINGLAGVSLRVSSEAAPTIATRLRDRAGADSSEWPADLRVQQFPGGGGASTGIEAAWGQDPDSALRTEATIDSLLARALLIRGRA